jgi:transcription-repair coupling factor (superfamily II helicase)
MNLWNSLKNTNHLKVHGINRGAYPSWLVSSLSKKEDGNILYIAANEGRSLEVMDELQFFLGQNQGSITSSSSMEIDHFPWVEGSIYNEILPERFSIQQRMATLARLLYEKSGHIMVAGIESLMRKVIPLEVFDSFSHLIGPGVTFDRESLALTLIKSGYQRVESVDERAAFAIRGQVVDLFIPLYPYPCRLIYFDDEIEEIWFFDPTSQKRIRKVDELLIHPVRETILSTPKNVRERLYALADKVDYPSSKTRWLFERINGHDDFFGMETLVPLYHSNMVSPFDYLPGELTIIIEDPFSVEQNCKSLLMREEEQYNLLFEEKRIVFPPDHFYSDFDEIHQLIVPSSYVEFIPVAPSEINSQSVEVKSHALLSLELKMARQEGLDPIGPLKKELDKLINEVDIVILAVPEEPASSPLVKMLMEYEYDISILKTGTPLLAAINEKTGIFALRGGVKSGFESTMENIAIISEEELFGRKVRKRTRGDRGFESDIKSAQTIEFGDYVVHKDNGIGRYGGIQKMDPGGIVGEYLLIEYLGGDKLFIPAHRVSVIARFKGGSSENVRLDKLGGKGWEKRKVKVTEKVKGLADNLLKLAADRADIQGFSYPADDSLLMDFESSFPFEETTDQKRTIEEVFNDMSSNRPMDRLICGDVGYGKTEVALRASFLAVLGGKQVAILAPTTLLTEQHGRTFKDRLASFPVETAVISRFVSPRKQKEVLRNLSSGKIDILIGTHRVLGKDIHFKDLGLLIVDEEQRFGVAQKESLKFFKPGLDVLSLSATPIPRTLHMGIMGLKDISLITTPPHDRLAVRTVVAQINPRIIKEAITRELARGGQVFMVVPRITGKRGSTRTIAEWKEFIDDLVPEAQAAIAHGQMDPQKLERIMVEFLSGSRKLLISTSIIESGLDISRANTIMVMDANNFGLSQLYQLRGRVGRGKVRAYAYFFISSFSTLTEAANKRLQAIQRYSHLGAGFNLASEDLEIRGAGDMLGKKQSGAIASVGFDAYVQIISEVMQELKGEKLPLKNDPELKSDISGYLPEEFIPDATERLIYYRRLSTADNETDVVDLSTLLEDKYGPLPKEAKLLIEMMKIKTELRLMNAAGISVSSRKIKVHLDNQTTLSPEKLLLLMGKNSDISFDGPSTISVRLSREKDPFLRLDTVQSYLHQLLSCVTSVK